MKPRLALAWLAATLAAQAPAAADPVAVALRMQEEMGGEAFADVRVIHFEWGVERDGERIVTWQHTWDRWTGDYRLEGVDRQGDGERLLALFDIGSRDGRVWIGERELTGEELESRLDDSYGRFINDSYWLLMPWKWLDPGVHLASVGTAEVDGRSCDVVELTFGEVGLTSNDRYYAYVDPETARMLRWAYVLQEEDGSPGSGEPVAWDWVQWRQVDPGVWFSERKEKVDDERGTAIVTEVVELLVEPSAAQLDALFRPR